MTHLLTVTPDEPTLDDPLRLELPGVDPDGLVLRSSLVDPAGQRWTSTGPLPAGDSEPVERMRWLWSMTPDPSAGPVPRPGPLEPTVVTFTVSRAGAPVAGARVPRHRVPPGVVREQLARPVGVLYHGDRPAPGVLLLGGTEGGLQEVHAALLARHGFTVLATGYYGLPGLPPVLSGVPVELFGTAAGWLLDHPAVSGDRVGIVGGSKGGEAALLAASLLPEFGAVVSIAGSGVITNGIGQDVRQGDFLQIVGTPTPCFTREGRDLPYLPNVVTDRVREAVGRGEPVALHSVLAPALRLADRVREATIPVERIGGPVLLVSSSDDAGYGRAYHDVAAERLERHGRAVTHLVHDGAGHGFIAPPWSPTTAREVPGPGVRFLQGGSAEADARARWVTWLRCLEFLREALA